MKTTHTPPQISNPVIQLCISTAVILLFVTATTIYGNMSTTEAIVIFTLTTGIIFLNSTGNPISTHVFHTKPHQVALTALLWTSVCTPILVIFFAAKQSYWPELFYYLFILALLTGGLIHSLSHLDTLPEPDDGQNFYEN